MARNLPIGLPIKGGQITGADLRNRLMATIGGSNNVPNHIHLLVNSCTKDPGTARAMIDATIKYLETIRKAL